ncbi:MAG TPA: hypothetical protein VLH38_00635 [Patescibacteria group bacterium]|nr:hypothetical protein [Patescibacteria group bacterium]
MHRFFHSQLLSRKYGGRAVAMLSFAIIGMVFLRYSYAATPAVSIQPEDGVVSGVGIGNFDPSKVSGGKAVLFGHNSFITRNGSILQLDGKQFRFAGPNIYWLGVDDFLRDSGGDITYPTHFRIDNVLAGATSMHSTAVRSHTLGVSVNCKNCMEPSLNQFNDAAFEPIDYAIEQAGAHNLKLMIPLTDEWRYNGGKWVFVHWAAKAGVPGVVDTKADLSLTAGSDYSGSGSEKVIEEQFFTNDTIVNYFKTYISHLLNHVNQYTGIAYKDDPTIMAWETGNELYDAPTSWTQNIASYIKHNAGAKQLVADGSAYSNNHVTSAALTAADVDIVGGHFYNWPNGLDTNWMAQDAAVAKQNNKAYVVGEWGWSMPGNTAFMSAIDSNKAIAGDLYWSMFGYQEDGKPIPHATLNYGSDDVPLYVPGISPTMNTAITNMTNHYTTMAAGNAP